MEHDGAKRHDGPSQGETIARYASISTRARARTTRAPRLVARRRVDSILDIDFQDTSELPPDLRIAEGGGRRTGDHQDIAWRHNAVLIASEKLAHQAFDPVTHYSASHPPACGDSEPGDGAAALFRNDDKACSGAPATFLLDADELRPFADAFRFRQPLVAAFGRQRGCFGGVVTVSRLRPLARRRFNTWRPPGLLMRARNPCVRLRRRLLGW
jgi:hypothetical protein